MSGLRLRLGLAGGPSFHEEVEERLRAPDTLAPKGPHRVGGVPRAADPALLPAADDAGRADLRAVIDGAGGAYAREASGGGCRPTCLGCVVGLLLIGLLLSAALALAFRVSGGPRLPSPPALRMPSLPEWPTAEPRPTRAPRPAASPRPRLRVGGFDYVVRSAAWGEAEEGMFGSRPRERFLVGAFTRNTTTQRRSLPEMVVLDSEGQVYPFEGFLMDGPPGMRGIKSGEKVLLTGEDVRSLPPGHDYYWELAFDVPRGATGLSLRLRDEAGQEASTPLGP